MSLGFSRSGSWILLFCLAASGLVERHAQAQGIPRSRRSIELTETNSAEILTNLNQLTVKKEGVQQLEDQLKSLKGVGGATSFEQRFNAPYGSQNASPASSKTIMELIERRKNWGLTPEEMTLDSKVSDRDILSAIADEKAEGKQSSLQQFYDALKGSGTSRTGRDLLSNESRSGQLKPSDSSNDDFSLGSDDDSKLPAGIREKAQKLKEMVTRDSTSVFNPQRSHSTFDNFFGLRENVAVRTAASDLTKTPMEAYMEQFKKELDTSLTGARIDPGLQSLLPEERKTPLPAMAPMPLTPHHEVTQTTPGNVGSVQDHLVLPDLNAAVLHSWNPMYTPPKLELPKYTPPAPPNLEFPRRRF